MEYLLLEIFDLEGTGSKYAYVPEDASITITDTSEIFGSGDVWSYPFKLNVRANAHIFGTVGDMHGSRLHEQINKRKTRLWVMKSPMYLGYLRLDDEVDVDDDGNIDVRFESGQKTFDEMIEGAKANQVPMMDDVPIGMALWRKRWNAFYLNMQACLQVGKGLTDYNDVQDSNGRSDIYFSKDSESEEDSMQQYPRMVFHKGKFFDATGSTETVEIDYLNTDTPYDDSHPYCNVALCYQKTGYARKNENGVEYNDYSGEPEAQRGYEVMPANRVNSAPNFYVIYWIKALMKHLGIYIEENQMMDVKDLRRLFFVNTNCAYEEPEKFRSVYDKRFGHFTSVLSGRLVPERIELKKNIDVSSSKLQCTSFQSDGDLWIDASGEIWEEANRQLRSLPAESIAVKIEDVQEFSDTGKQSYIMKNSLYHYAYATSECFPNVDISEVINALESGFGVRFLFSDSYQRVRIVLLRNIFRSNEVQKLNCEVISDVKVENSIRGFRMTYGNSDDTAFYYKGFADKLPHKKPYFVDNSDKHDYSKWNLDADYSRLIKKVSAFDKTCYVTANTGNSYGIKVDKNAKRYEELFPSLFEYAGYMDAEDGDCSGDEETIYTVNVGFVPAIMNDVKYEKQREDSNQGQQFALFVDEKMRPRRSSLEDLPNDSQPGVKSYDDSDAIYDTDKMYAMYGPDSGASMVGDDGIVKPGEFAIRSDMMVQMSGLKATLRGSLYMEMELDHSLWGVSTFKGLVRFSWPVTFDIDGFITEGYRLYLQDNYEPNDNGVSPIESHDWGLTLGIMRGSGNDAGVEYGADPDDGEGNDTWDVVAGSNVTTHPDTCDSYGREWDYGDGEDGAEGRLSLKLRAEKLNPFFNAQEAESDTNRRYLEITNKNLQRRGLCDQMYKEYSFWLRNARVTERTVRMELAQFLAIDKTKKTTVEDITGFIKKMQFSVNNKSGLGLVKMEIMYI